MPSKSSAAKMPLPIGMDEESRTHTPSTVLPPASPKGHTAAAVTPSQNFTVENARAQMPQYPHSTSERTPTSLPFIISTADGVPRSQTQRHSQQQQQQQRATVGRRSSVASESPGGAVMNAFTSPQHRISHGAVSPVTRSIGVHMAPLDAPAVEEGRHVAAGFTPNSMSATSPRQTRKPPTMNPNLFLTGAPDPALSPSNTTTQNTSNHTVDYGVSGSFAGYSGAASPLANGAAATPAEPSRTNLILYNVAPHMTEEALHELFDVFGEVVSCAVMREIHTGESLGTAFVRFALNAEARRALYAFSDRTRPVPLNDSKPLVVQWARKQHDDNPVGEARKKIMKLFVRNIPLDCTVETLEMLFGRYGDVRQVTLHKDTAPVEDAAMERLIAFVIYTEEGAAERAAAAVHNTRPFPSCYGIPVMIKLAEDQVRHDRTRGQHNDQPALSHQRQQQQQQQQQHQQQQRQLHCEATNYAEPAYPPQGPYAQSPQSPSNISTGSNNNSSRGGQVPLSPYEFHQVYPAGYVQPATYFPPSALMSATSAPSTPQAGGRLQSPPSSGRTLQVSIRPVFHTPTSAGGPCQHTQSHPALCSPLATPLSYHATSPPHRTTAPQPIAASVCTTRAVSSPRMSPELGGEGGGFAAVSIPNPRSATRAATHANSARAARGVTSPCLSVDSISMPLSPAAATEGLRSPVIYRHNPYSMASSTMAY